MNYWVFCLVAYFVLALGVGILCPNYICSASDLFLIVGFQEI